MASVALGTAVVAGSDADKVSEVAAMALSAGDVVYLDKFDGGRVKKASTASAQTSQILGVALNSAGVNQPVSICWRGTITGTATLVVGEAYFVSDTAGQVYPAADLGANDFGAFLGFAVTATSLKIAPFSAGVSHA
jgi:hypothetical protein